MQKDKILLDHGSGGQLSNRLIAERILPVFDNSILNRMNDGACLDVDGKRLAFSTDSFIRFELKINQ